MTRHIHQTNWRGIPCSQLCLWILWPCWTDVKLVLHIQLKRHSKVTSSWANTGCIPKVTAKRSHRKCLKTGIWFVRVEAALSRTPAESCCWQDSSDGEDIGVFAVHGKNNSLTNILISKLTCWKRELLAAVLEQDQEWNFCVWAAKKAWTQQVGKAVQLNNQSWEATFTEIIWP